MRKLRLRGYIARHTAAWAETEPALTYLRNCYFQHNVHESHESLLIFRQLSATYPITICDFFTKNCLVMMPIVKCKALLEKQQKTEEISNAGFLEYSEKWLAYKATKKPVIRSRLHCWTLIVKMFFLPGREEIAL